MDNQRILDKYDFVIKTRLTLNGKDAREKVIELQKKYSDLTTIDSLTGVNNAVVMIEEGETYEGVSVSYGLIDSGKIRDEASLKGVFKSDMEFVVGIEDFEVEFLPSDVVKINLG